MFGFFNQRFLVELYYNKYITDFVLKLGGQTTKVIDKGSIELVGPFGLEKGLVSLSRSIASLDTGVITTYSIYITLSLLSLIFLIFAPILIDTSLLNEIRLFIIYIASLIIVLSPSNKIID